MKFNSKLIIVLFLIFSGCNVKHVYTVYDKNLKKTKLNLCNSEQVVILKNNVSCIPCLPELLNEIEFDKDIVIVSIIDKNKLSAKYEENEILKLINDKKENTKIFFQFSRTKDNYEYHPANKIFKHYHLKESPIMIISDEGCYFQIVKPSDLN